METLNCDFDRLVKTFILENRPNASALDVGNTIRRLRAQIEAGDIDKVEVMRRIKPRPFRLIPSISFGDLARACRDLDEGRLTLRERGFVLRMCALGFARRPSQRQAEWLAAIFARLHRRRAA